MRLNVGKNKNKNNDGTTDKDLSTVVLWSALDTILVVSVMHLIEMYAVILIMAKYSVTKCTNDKQKSRHKKLSGEKI